MLARCKISYSANEVVKKFDREKWEALRKAVWGLRLPEWPEGNNAAPSWYCYGDDTVFDLSTEASILSECGIEFEVKEFKSTYKTAGKDGQGNTHNLTLALPNIGLLAMDEVTWREDYCTESLQGDLDEGWRILAVCPPNGTRRPTYILGRTKGADK